MTGRALVPFGSQAPAAPDPLTSIRVPAAPAFPGSRAMPGTQRPQIYLDWGWALWRGAGGLSALWSTLFSSYNNQGWGRRSEYRVSPRFSASLLPSCLPLPLSATPASPGSSPLPQLPAPPPFFDVKCTYKVSSVVLRIKVFR